MHRNVEVVVHYRRGRKGVWRVELLRMDRAGGNSTTVVLGVGEPDDTEASAEVYARRCADAIGCPVVRGTDVARAGVK